MLGGGVIDALVASKESPLQRVERRRRGGLADVEPRHLDEDSGVESGRNSLGVGEDSDCNDECAVFKVPSFRPPARHSTGPNPRAFRSLAQGVRGIARAQTLVDIGVPATLDVAGLVQRIAVTLSSWDTYQKVAKAIFTKFAVGSTPSEEEARLPLQKLEGILAHWLIPEDHAYIFWAMLRKQDAFWDSYVLPESIPYDDFQVVLGKFLRRVRDKYCVDHKVAKGRFVTQNTRRLEEDYLIEDSCGKGSFGECFYVEHRLSKLRRVCKKIIKEGSSVPAEEVQGELNTLKMLDHPHILRVFEWFESEDAYYLVLEAALGGDLKHLLSRARETGAVGLDEDLVQVLVGQSLLALVYIHSLHVIHRDVKPANMLLATADFKRPMLLLADFGVAELFEEHGPMSSMMKGTVAYMAPEIFASEVSPRSDVWALGVVIYELLCGERPYNAANPMAMYARLKTASVNYDPIRAAVASPESAIDFIQRLLQKNISDRPSAVELMNESWLQEQGKSIAPTGRKARKMKRSLSNYMRMSYFSKAAMNCIAAQLDTSKVEGLTKIFQDFDTDHDGRLSMAEFAVGLAELGVDPDAIGQLVDAVDLNNDGSVQYSEFVAALLHTQAQLVEDVILHAFNLFDSNGDKYISLDELRHMLSGNGPLVAVLPDGKTVEEVLTEVRHGDTQRSCISFQEFRAYLRREADCKAEKPELRRQAAVAEMLREGPVAKSDPATQEPSAPGIVDNVPLEVVIRELVSTLGRTEAELLSHARRLEEMHWISTVGDLRGLKETDWWRLGLPLKLECALRQHVSRI